MSRVAKMCNGRSWGIMGCQRGRDVSREEKKCYGMSHYVGQ